MPSAQIMGAAPMLVLGRGKKSNDTEDVVCCDAGHRNFAILPAKAATYSASFDGSFFDVFAQITTDGLDNVTVITGTVVGSTAGR